MEGDPVEPPPTLIKVVGRLMGYATELVQAAEFVPTTRQGPEGATNAGDTEGPDVEGWLVQLQGGFALNRAPFGHPAPAGRTMNLFVSAEGEVLDVEVGDRPADLASLGEVGSIPTPLLTGGD
jgi:hypothetical protein